MFIGENLKNLRILYSYSQPSLAEVTNIPERDIWQYENGYKQPTFEHVNVLKRLFNVRSSYFFCDDILSNNRNNVNVDYVSFRFLHE